MSKVRNHHFDNIKALLILLVVFGHLIEPLRDIQLFKITYFIIYSFHMPLFIFMAGYFAKPNTKGIKKLSLLLLKYEIIYGLTYFVLFGSTGESSGSLLSTIGYVLQPIWVLWFLLSLICWRLLLIAYEKHPVAIAIIIAIIIGFNFVPFNFRILSLGRTLSFFPYFLFGYLANKHNFNFHRIERNRTFAFYFLGMLLIFWTLYSATINDELLYGATSLIDQGYSLLAISIFKINTYLVAIAASIVVFNLVPRRENFFTQVGLKTLPIFIWHPIIIWLLIRINFFEQIRQFNSIFSFIILLVLSGLITLFLKDRTV